MAPSLIRLLTRAARGDDEHVVCAVCREPLDDLPRLRIRGAVLHRDCLGYRARQQLNGTRQV